MNTFRYTVIMLVGCSLVLIGCGLKTKESAKKEQPRLAEVNCIAVLPAASISEGKVVPIYVPKDKNERQGVQSMNEILSDALGGKEKIRFVGIDQVATMDFTGGENQLALVRMVAERVKCNTVLESSVKRYSERVGGQYSVESPASVAFEMRLLSVENGSVLWSAEFDESQKSVMENLLEWKKANTRGFVWITAKDLMREGVKTKLAASPYFNPVEK